MTEGLYARDSYLSRVRGRRHQVPRPTVSCSTAPFSTPAAAGNQATPGCCGGPAASVASSTRRKSRGPRRGPCTPSRTPGGAAVGTAVTAEIDWERRYRHMRTHTALHALSGVVYTDFGAKVTGGNRNSGGVARMDFELDAISQEFGHQVEETTERPPRRGRARARAPPSPRRGAGRPRPDPYESLSDPRVGRSDPRDRYHGHRPAGRRWHSRRASGEVGRVHVVKTESKGKANKRIRIQLEPKCDSPLLSRRAGRRPRRSRASPRVRPP